MADPRIYDEFHRHLVTRLTETIQQRMSDLAGGGASRKTDNVGRLQDIYQVAESYAAATAEIRAFNAVLELCDQISLEMYGIKREEGE